MAVEAVARSSSIAAKRRRGLIGVLLSRVGKATGEFDRPKERYNFLAI